MNAVMTMEEMKKQYPDEWILVGNPKWDERNTRVLSGEVLYHNPDKMEMFTRGKPFTKGYDHFTWCFSHVTPRAPLRTIGIMKTLQS